MAEPERPIRYGMVDPHRIRSEYDVVGDRYWLIFDGVDGSQIRIGLSRVQAEALANLRSRDPHSMARDLYLAGRITVEEFEERLST